MTESVIYILWTRSSCLSFFRSFFFSCSPFSEVLVMALLVSQSFGSFCTKSSLSIFRFLKTLLVRADLPDMEAVSMLWNIFTKSFLILYSYLQIVLILETFWKCLLNNHFPVIILISLYNIYLQTKKERTFTICNSIPPSGNFFFKITMFSMCYVYIKIFYIK